jgi:hypothetical protein
MVTGLILYGLYAWKILCLLEGMMKIQLSSRALCAAVGKFYSRAKNNVF